MENHTVQRPHENQASEYRHEEHRRGVVPAPRATSSKSTGLHAMGYAGGFGNVTTLEDDTRWPEDSDEEAYDFAKPRSGSTQADVEPADADRESDLGASDERSSSQENAAIQEAISSLNAMQVQQRAQTGALQPGKGPGSSACFHHMIGKCNKGAECTFSHGKGDAAELLKMLNANFARNNGSDTTISSIVEGITNADVMRIHLRVNGTAARTLIDTGAVF